MSSAKLNVVRTVMGLSWGSFPNTMLKLSLFPNCGTLIKSDAQPHRVMLVNMAMSLGNGIPAGTVIENGNSVATSKRHVFISQHGFNESQYLSCFDDTNIKH